LCLAGAALAFDIAALGTPLPYSGLLFALLKCSLLPADAPLAAVVALCGLLHCYYLAEAVIQTLK